MIQLNAIYGGPAIGKTETVNPASVMVSLIDENPNATQDELITAFYERIHDDPDYVKAACRYLGYGILNSITAMKRRNAPTLKKRQLATRVAIAEMAKHVATKIRHTVILDLILPNGKPARDSTFSDCKRAGGMWLKIAAMGKPRQIVGKTITDAEAQKTWDQKE